MTNRYNRYPRKTEISFFPWKFTAISLAIITIALSVYIVYNQYYIYSESNVNKLEQENTDLSIQIINMNNTIINQTNSIKNLQIEIDILKESESDLNERLRLSTVTLSGMVSIPNKAFFPKDIKITFQYDGIKWEFPIKSKKVNKYKIPLKNFVNYEVTVSWKGALWTGGSYTHQWHLDSKTLEPIKDWYPP